MLNYERWFVIGLLYVLALCALAFALRATWDYVLR